MVAIVIALVFYRFSVPLFPMMIASETVRHPLLKVLLLAGILLAGRFLLATHPYEHDLATLGTHCVLCDICQVFADGLVESSISISETYTLESPQQASRIPNFLSRKSTRFPRAPPIFLV
jgi:hypothetical protein